MNTKYGRLMTVIGIQPGEYEIEYIMLQKELISEFLKNETIAVVGVSRKGDIPANHIFRKFKAAGYNVFPINPNAETVEGEKCYPELKSLPSRPGAVMLAGTPKTTEASIMDCIENEIPVVWMHKGIGVGSYSETAEKAATSHNIKVISNGCPMMFVNSVDPFHRILKWWKN